MKKVQLILIMALLTGFSFAQEDTIEPSDSTQLEGENLDLNGVLELFKESEDIEDFEKKLNTESNGVNNLDLNEDGEVDYIRVVDHADSNSHALALQVPVNESESQDVAVLEIEEVDEETVNLQVIGDSELYGEEYMLEPADEKDAKVVVNVYNWRPVRFVYGPRYRVWSSPYRWGYYPRWHRPWRRVAWGSYYPRVRRYHRPCYRITSVRRCHRTHKFYHAHHHVHSPYFHNHHHYKHAYHKNGGAKSNNTKASGGKNTTAVKQTNGADAQGKKTTVVKKNTDSGSAGKKTTVKKESNGTVRKKQTTVRKNPSSKETKGVQRQRTQTQRSRTSEKSARTSKQRTKSSGSKRKSSTRNGKR